MTLNILCININLLFGRRNFLNTMYKNIKDITSEFDSAKHVAKNPEDLQKLGKYKYFATFLLLCL